MAEHSRLTQRLIADGASRTSTFGLGPAWRRGIMHTVERIDLVLAKKQRPAAALAEIRATLDDLAQLQREHMPATYQDAFDICRADLARAQRKPGEAA